MSVKAALYASCPALLRPFWDRIESSELGYRLAKGAFWSLVGTVMSSGLGLLASILVARMLGKTVYGELGMVRSTVGMFGALAGLGLGLTATKHIAEFRHVDRVRAGRIMTLSGQVAFATGALAATACFVLAPWLAANVLAAPQLASLIRIGCLVLFLEAITGAQTGALAGFEAFRSIAQLNLAVGLIAFPCLVVGAYLGGLPGVVWGMVANTGIKWGLSHLALRRQAAQASIPFRFSDGWCEIGVLWQFSIPATLASMIVAPVTWACNAILANQPDGYAELGIFAAASQWQAILFLLPSMMLHAALPIMSNVAGQGDQTSLGALLRATTLLTMLVVVPLGALLLCIPHVPMLLYGDAYQDGQRVLYWILVSVMVQSIGTASGIALQAQGRMWVGLAVNGIYSVLLFLFVSCFASSLGAASIALGMAASYTVLTAIVFAVLLRDVPGGPQKILFPSLAFIGLIVLLTSNVSARVGELLALPIFLLCVLTLTGLLVSGTSRKKVEGCCL